MTDEQVAKAREILRVHGWTIREQDVPALRAALAAAQAGAANPHGPLTPTGERVWREGFVAGIEAAAREVEATYAHPSLPARIRALRPAETAEGDGEAKRRYTAHTDNHPTIHSNRFPAWDELSEISFRAGRSTKRE